ncbi:uncharacterized protein LOC106167323 [Lingula anatina]|uniref:Uncharacterized protein LOC106167323 n=1 Tax=Lingula anatina TaxID=7574 RepID=A0A2R2MRU8_LINAN|nr:uncharacterized protein LOC106167323 [Lingula anatina]|eukprot:XP_023932727.1 uncharacterized protein LOC106167323 [Lingula anatina]
MARGDILLTAFTAILLLCQAGAEVIAPRASFSCSRNPDELVVSVTDSEDVTIRAVYVQGKRSIENCVAKEGNGSIYNPHKLVLNASFQNECGIMGDGMPETPYTVTVLAVRSPKIETSHDYAFLLSCETVTTTQTVMREGMSIQRLQYIQEAANKISEQVKMDLVDMTVNASGLPFDEPVISCVMGRPVAIRITLTPSGNAKGIHPISCVIAPSISKRSYLQLLQNSCPVTDNPPAAVLVTGFSQHHTDPTLDGAIIQSGTFECFRFPDVNTLHIECEVDFCPDAENLKCTHAPDCPFEAAVSRRRRSATNYTDHSTIGATILVQTLPEVLHSGKSDSGAIESSIRSCIQNIGFMVLLVILVVLCVVSVCVTAVFCWRAWRYSITDQSNLERRKKLEREGIANIAF